MKYLWTEDSGAGLHFWKKNADVDTVENSTESNWGNCCLTL